MPSRSSYTYKFSWPGAEKILYFYAPNEVEARKLFTSWMLEQGRIIPKDSVLVVTRSS